VPLHYDRAIMMFDINRSGRRIVVMVMNPMLVMAIGVPPMMAAVIVCQRNASTDKEHKRGDCKYFQIVAFHGVLLFSLDLHRLDGAAAGRVYIGFEARVEREN
jgi:hypothetical protein